MDQERPSYTEPSPAQIDYVRSLQRRHKLPNALLDNYCVEHYGTPVKGLTRRDASALIDRMKEWTTLPADIQRAAGQRDLPGIG